MTDGPVSAMQCPVASAWFEVEERGGGHQRLDLTPGCTEFGGPEGPLAQQFSGACGADRLRVWEAPARLAFTGTGEPPRVNGAPAQERELAPGDRIEWHGCTLVFRRAAQLQEEPLVVAPASPGSAGSAGKAGRGEGRLWRRVKAGLLVELGLVGPAASRPWQDAVQAGSFEPDDCARDLLAATEVEADDPRLLERTARLQRDLLMAPLQSGAKGARRRARAATRNGLAYAVAQLVIVGMFAALALTGLLVGRLLLGWSIDGFLDGIGSVFGS